MSRAIHWSMVSLLNSRSLSTEAMNCNSSSAGILVTLFLHLDSDKSPFWTSVWLSSMTSFQWLRQNYKQKWQDLWNLHKNTRCCYQKGIWLIHESCCSLKDPLSGPCDSSSQTPLELGCWYEVFVKIMWAENTWLIFSLRPEDCESNKEALMDQVLFEEQMQEKFQDSARRAVMESGQGCEVPEDPSRGRDMGLRMLPWHFWDEFWRKTGQRSRGKLKPMQQCQEAEGCLGNALLLFRRAILCCAGLTWPPKLVTEKFKNLLMLGKEASPERRRDRATPQTFSPLCRSPQWFPPVLPVKRPSLTGQIKAADH